jgi:competence protein ComFC
MNAGMQRESNVLWKCWLEAIAGFFYPNVCQVCGVERATAATGYVGAGCWQKVRFIQRPFCEVCGLPFDGNLTTLFECSNCRDMKLHFASARSAVTAKGVVLDVIHQYKYHRALWFEPFLAGLLTRQATPCLSPKTWDVIVPVPLYPTKQRQREFNQAERLARRLSQTTQIPLCSRWLRREKFTHTQTKLSRSERAANVRNAFGVRKGVRLHGERVVLVDDVLTTGATTNACALALRQAGAEAVCVWTVARGV